MLLNPKTIVVGFFETKIKILGQQPMIAGIKYISTIQLSKMILTFST